MKKKGARKKRKTASVDGSVDNDAPRKQKKPKPPPRRKQVRERTGTYLPIRIESNESNCDWFSTSFVVAHIFVVVVIPLFLCSFSL
jgi:hypothetical protein